MKVNATLTIGEHEAITLSETILSVSHGKFDFRRNHEREINQ